ncbi:MAG: transglutaminase, partial [Bacteroidota bacterium]|nr:transglutaminase [Bacteroidota bacterium]
TIGDNAEMVADFIYFNPMLFEQVKSNLFKLKERKYPVDFSYPRKETYILNLEVPEGYLVDELPASFQIQLPGKSAVFSYMINTNGNKIQLLNKIFINKPVFVYNEYSELVDFYNKIVEKHAEQIVFKKINEPINQQ